MAQITGSLNPAGGNFYRFDAEYQGMIGAAYTDTVDFSAAVATITVGENSYVAEIAADKTTAVSMFAKVAEKLDANSVADGTAFSLTVSGVPGVANLSGNYTYRHAFPLTSPLSTEGGELANKVADVVFTFNQLVTYDRIEITSGTVTETKTNILPEAKGDGTYTVTVPLLETNWGQAFAGVIPLQVAIKDTKDANGTFISNVSGNIGTILVNYKFVDKNASASFLGVDPEVEWTYADDLLGWDTTFKFSNEVAMGTGDIVTITYYGTAIGTTEVVPFETVTLPASSLFASWSRMRDYYGIQIPIAEPALISLYTLSYLTIQLTGLTSGNTEVVVPLVTYENPTTFRAPTRGFGNEGDGTTGIQTEKVQENVNIYSIEGILLEKDVPAATVNTLPKGIYIVGGKKMIVK